MISQLFIFLIETSVCLMAFYLLFKMVFERYTFFQWSRFYLLGSVVLSIIIPLLDFPVNVSAQPEFIESSMMAIEQTEGLLSVNGVAMDGITLPESSNDYPFSTTLFLVYCIGTVITFVIFTIRFYTLTRLLRDSTQQHNNGYKLIEISTGKLPFSFLDYIFIPINNKLSPIERQQIIKHELVHISQRHSWDILFVEAIAIFLWFNPLLWFYKNSLKETHEFIADAVVEGVNTTDYSMLLLRLATKKSFSLTNGFAKIPIKNRIIMLHKNKTNNVKKISFFSAIPLAIMLIFIFSFSLKEEVRESIVQKSPEIPTALIAADTIPSIKPINENDINKLVSGYGMRIHPKYKTKKMHTGVDFAAKIGVPVLSTADGIIKMTKQNVVGHGLHIRVKHGGNFSTMYSHLSKISVSEGEPVLKGDTIGLVGNSGYSTGPHLHYEVIKNGEMVNPVNYF